MTDKTASVHWEGRGKNGVGKISTQTDALKAYPYGYGSRFEDDRRGTNPEELLAAAHAACFTMAFSFACDAAGFATEAVDTQAAVRLVMKGGGFQIDRITLRLEASVPGVDEATFQKLAAGAKAGCPLSKALTGVPEIGLTAHFAQIADRPPLTRCRAARRVHGGAAIGARRARATAPVALIT